MRGRYSDGKTLRGVLSPKSATKVDSLLHLYGLSLDQVNGFKPWMVSLLMTQLAMQKLNFQAQYGVDMQLNARAKQASKPVLGLESVDFQLGLFDSLSPADQERMLVESDGPDVTAKELGSIRDAWSHGDAPMLDSLINSRVAEAPTLFDALITARNRAGYPRSRRSFRAATTRSSSSARATSSGSKAWSRCFARRGTRSSRCSASRRRRSARRFRRLLPPRPASTHRHSRRRRRLRVSREPGSRRRPSRRSRRGWRRTSRSSRSIAAFGKAFVDSRSVADRLARASRDRAARALRPQGTARIAHLAAHRRDDGRLLLAYLAVRQLVGRSRTDVARRSRADGASAHRADGRGRGREPFRWTSAERTRYRIRAHAAATDNIGVFFGEDIFIAIGSILLIRGFLDQNGIHVEADEPRRVGDSDRRSARSSFTASRLLLLDRSLARDAAGEANDEQPAEAAPRGGTA